METKKLCVLSSVSKWLFWRIKEWFKLMNSVRYILFYNFQIKSLIFYDGSHCAYNSICFVIKSTISTYRSFSIFLCAQVFLKLNNWLVYSRKRYLSNSYSNLKMLSVKRWLYILKWKKPKATQHKYSLSYLAQWFKYSLFLNVLVYLVLKWQLNKHLF